MKNRQQYTTAESLPVSKANGQETLRRRKESFEILDGVSSLTNLKIEEFINKIIELK